MTSAARKFKEDVLDWMCSTPGRVECFIMGLLVAVIIWLGFQIWPSVRPQNEDAPAFFSTQAWQDEVIDELYNGTRRGL